MLSRRTANEITQGSIPILLELCKKSFICKDSHNRCSQHPLMWQYVREKFNSLVENNMLKQQYANYL